MPPRVLLLLVFLTACATREEALVPFDPAVGAGLSPEILEGQDRGDYSLSYRLKADGSGITTRFFGPSEAMTAVLDIHEEIEADEHVLICIPGGSGYRVPLARWKLDASGRATEIRVRTEPVAEIRRWRDREPGELVAPFEWRPWIDGKGVGAWRR